MALLETALVLQQLAGNSTRIDLVVAGTDGLPYGGHLVCIHHRGFGDGLFDFFAKSEPSQSR